MKPYQTIPLIACTILAACNLPSNTATPTPDTGALSTMVAASLQALTPLTTSTSAPSPTSTQLPDTATASFTPNPTLTATPTLTHTPATTDTPTKTPIPKPGSISGAVYGYPYGDIPRLVIVAFKQNTPYFFYLINMAGSTNYLMDAYVSPGRYQVIAYDAAGHAGGCTIIIVVESEKTATCDISDWTNAYRSKPGDVPNP